MERLTGVVRHYQWGDPEIIPTLIGEAPDGRPWAELWFGTHPDGPARLPDGRELSEISGPLPYLLKLLAAREPLSLQLHPDAARARERHRAGYYPDPLPKPELLCALTEFDALCGIRPAAATVALLDDIGTRELAASVRGEGPGETLARLYRGTLDPDPIVAACASSTRPEARLVTELADSYPSDPSVAVTLLLNRVRLEPGEAIFLPAGNLHAYLRGAAVELMGASDNVVRGGLTVKPVDVAELLAIVDRAPLADPVLRPTEVAAGTHRYDVTPDDDIAPPPFELWRVETRTTSQREWTAEGNELLLCTTGGTTTWPRGTTVHVAPDERVALPSGSTIFIARPRV